MCHSIHASPVLPDTVESWNYTYAGMERGQSRWLKVPDAEQITRYLMRIKSVNFAPSLLHRLFLHL